MFGEPHESRYQAECADQPAQERHCVDVHCCRHAGHTPPVSKVCQRWWQVHDQRSPLAGVQPHSGQRMPGPAGPWPLSTSRSTTVDGFTFTIVS